MGEPFSFGNRLIEPPPVYGLASIGNYRRPRGVNRKSLTVRYFSPAQHAAHGLKDQTGPSRSKQGSAAEYAAPGPGA
jgi:hypothetical protein